MTASQSLTKSYKFLTFLLTARLQRDIFLTSSEKYITLQGRLGPEKEQIIMNKKVSLRELVADKIVFALLLAVYYWMWARNDWRSFYPTIK